MIRAMSIARDFASNESGATAIEYSAAAFLILVVALVAVNSISASVSEFYGLLAGAF